MRDLHTRYVADAWLAPKRRHRARRVAKWAAAGRLVEKAQLAISRGGPEALD